MSAVCHRGRSKSWRSIETIGDGAGEHNVTAYSTAIMWMSLIALVMCLAILFADHTPPAM
jgi:hypothetical protein